MNAEVGMGNAECGKRNRAVAETDTRPTGGLWIYQQRDLRP
jgi:hypothetical protein